MPSPFAKNRFFCMILELHDIMWLSIGAGLKCSLKRVVYVVLFDSHFVIFKFCRLTSFKRFFDIWFASVQIMAHFNDILRALSARFQVQVRPSVTVVHLRKWNLFPGALLNNSNHPTVWEILVIAHLTLQV